MGVSTKSGELHYAYLDRTSRSPFVHVRETLQEWFDRYPAPHAHELATRIQTDDDTQFDGAFFELYLHELMVRLGFEVEVHPDSPDLATDRAPDFFCRASDDRAFYLEATVARELSAEEEAAQARKNQFYDALERLHSPNFFIWVEFSGSPATPPPARNLREFLEKKLASLDPDHLVAVLQEKGFDSLPHWAYSHEGWDVELVPLPKSPELRGEKGVRPLGAFMPAEAVRRADAERLRSSFADKAGVYGSLQRPYVVAVNAQFVHVDPIDEMAALFGSEAYVFSRTNLEKPARLERQPDGLWTAPAGPTNRRMSAAIVGRHVLPWTVGVSSVRLYPNPWARYPIGDLLERLPRAEVQQVKFEWVEETHPRDLLKLPDGWPGFEGEE